MLNSLYQYFSSQSLQDKNTTGATMNVTLDPPLRTTTVLGWSALKPIRFTAVLEVHRQTGDYDVALWHTSGKADNNNNEWVESTFKEVSNSEGSVNIHNKALNPGSTVKVFILDLTHEGNTPLQFTLKYKRSKDNDWIWSGQGEGEDDGSLIFRPFDLNAEPHVEIDEIFRNIPPNINARKVSSDVSHVMVWDATVSIPALKTTDTTLGLPTHMERFFSTIKNPWPWMSPEHGKKQFRVPRDCYFLSFIRCDGLNVAVLPFSGVEHCTSYLTSDDNGNVVLKGRNDGAVEAMSRCIIAVGYDFQRTVDATFYKARSILYDASHPSEDSLMYTRTDRWTDGLGYCTWNGIGADLTEDKIVDTLKDLETTGVKISTLIIDDNWQTLDNRRWVRFEANKEGFPNGLKGFTKKIKETFPYIKYIAVWHALYGYWNGIMPGGEIDREYNGISLKKLPFEHAQAGKPTTDESLYETLQVVDSQSVARMYDDFYKFLSDSGIDGVKTDDQCFTDEIGSPEDRARLTTAYTDAHKASSKKYFDHRVIYCMAHVPNIMFRTLMPRDRRPVLFRNSDDFFPHIPDSHTWHVFANALNNIYTCHLNATPDWDMFQTKFPNGKDLTKCESFSGLHAAVRCVSGGPIYVTDQHSKHNIELLSQITAPSSAGYSVILRPSNVALPSNPYTGFHDRKLLRIRNVYGSGRQGRSLIAILNVSKTGLSETLSFDELRGSYADVEYLLRAFRSGETFGGKLRDENAPILFHLPEAGWEIFTAVPVQKLPVETNSNVKVCTFGLLGQMTGVCAVTGTSMKVGRSGQVTYEVKLKAMGTLGVWLSNMEKISLENIMVCIGDKAVPQSAIRVDKLLEIDVLSAWAEMNQEERYDTESNDDLAVQIIFKY